MLYAKYLVRSYTSSIMVEVGVLKQRGERDTGVLHSNVDCDRRLVCVCSMKHLAYPMILGPALMTASRGLGMS